MEFDAEAAKWLAPALGSVAFWFDRNRKLIVRVFNEFQITTKWPEIDKLQRQLDHELGIAAPQLDQVWSEAPRGTAYIDNSDNTNKAALQLRVLARIPNAAPMLNKFMEVLKLAMERYQEQKEELTSSEMMQVAGLTERQLGFISTFLFHEWPLQVNRNMKEDGSWVWHLDPGNRRFMGVQTLEQFLDIQARLIYRPYQAMPFVDSLPVEALGVDPSSPAQTSVLPELELPPSTVKTRRNWGGLFIGLASSIGFVVSGLLVGHAHAPLGAFLLVAGALALVGAAVAWRRL